MVLRKDRLEIAKSGMKTKSMKVGPLRQITKEILKYPFVFLAKRLYEGREYVPIVPYGYRVFSPWFDTSRESEFARILSLVRSAGRLTVSPDRCYFLYQFCRHCSYLCGEMAECGVYTGGTAQLLAIVMREYACKPRLHLFDTFSGMPDTAIPDRDSNSPGDYSFPLDRVRERLKEFTFLEFHPGLMPETFAEVGTNTIFSFVHVDADIYPSVLDCCKWFWPRLHSGGMMIFDDYGMFGYRYAARAAVDEYFSSIREKPIALPTGQAIVIKT